MKLYFIFLLIDLLVLLAYPVVFVIYQVRKLFQIKR
jgi:cell division protein FtsL